MPLFIDTNELAELLNTTRRNASEIIKAVNDDLKKQGYLTLNTRPLKAPRKAVLEKLGVKE